MIRDCQEARKQNTLYSSSHGRREDGKFVHGSSIPGACGRGEADRNARVDGGGATIRT